MVTTQWGELIKTEAPIEFNDSILSITDKEQDVIAVIDAYDVMSVQLLNDDLNAGQLSVLKKMQYVIDLIGKGPLSSVEEGELIQGLESRKDHSSLWGIAIKSHFESGMDHKEFIEGLASQCSDDIFTMSCVVGLGNAILLLRTIQN